MLIQPTCSNMCWSADFMSDALSSGYKFRTFNVIDDYNREALMVEPGYSLPADRVIMLLDQIALARGYPDMIRVDNVLTLESRINLSKTIPWHQNAIKKIHFILPM